MTNVIVFKRSVKTHSSLHRPSNKQNRPPNRPHRSRHSRRRLSIKTKPATQNNKPAQATQKATQQPINQTTQQPAQPKKPTDKQLRRMWAITKKADMTNDIIHDFVRKAYRKNCIKELTVRELDNMIARIKLEINNNIGV